MNYHYSMEMSNHCVVELFSSYLQLNPSILKKLLNLYKNHSTSVIQNSNPWTSFERLLNAFESLLNNKTFKECFGFFCVCKNNLSFYLKNLTKITLIVFSGSNNLCNKVNRCFEWFNRKKLRLNWLIKIFLFKIVSFKFV
jgi:hypothetical protein